MNILLPLLAALLSQSPTAKAPTTPSPMTDPPFVCANCDEWNQPQAPFKIHGRTYYVGMHGVSAILIQTSAGLILLDGGLPQSAAPIEANIRSLGLRVEDVKLIVNSHAHYDHSGGIARLQRDTGATVAASASGAKALMSGAPDPDDPQYGNGKEGAFPRVPKVQIVGDGEELRVGDTGITAHLTPGHTPGSTTWTWKSCVEKSCVNVVYADSLNAVSLDDFRFLGDKTHADVSGVFRQSIAKVRALPCDILLSVHPDGSALFDRLKLRSPTASKDPLIDPAACRVYADTADQRLTARLKTERAPAAK